MSSPASLRELTRSPATIDNVLIQTAHITKENLIRV